jgi:uncharacterized protein (TIGR00251 family)
MALQYAGVVDDLFDLLPPAEPQGRSPDGAPEGASPAAHSGVRLRVHLRPGAGRSAVVGRQGDALAVRVAAPPSDARADAACLALLREELGIEELELESGERAGDKVFLARDVDVEAFRRRLHELLEEAGAPHGGGRGTGRAHRR